ncbi:hypothetical protein MKW98_006926 [Papaver atlanticum]|uniref:Uncharacterized protein n=1 Tax=Papaver atlanticum TaxID=357466 RepID=A0AAD4ST65_9MAGN|nr:hypothetical protein MKW98_006926 [Papaver atlanticum]
MGSGSDSGRGKGFRNWSVYDGMKIFHTPIAASEYSHAYALLKSTSSTSSSKINSNSNETKQDQLDVRMADEAYKDGCAALASGKLDEALQSLQIALSKCPPHKASAISKLQSLIKLTSQQQIHKPHG